MSALTSTQIIDIWERGRYQSVAERAELLLQLAFPQASKIELLRLTIGQRDSVLLRLRELTFGATVSCVGECPECWALGERRVEIASLLGEHPSDSGRLDFLFEQDGFQIRFRPVRGTDLHLLRRAKDSVAARHALMACIISSCQRNGAEVDLRRVPEQVVDDLAEAVADSDPQSELWVDIKCPECGTEFDAILDIMDFFWREIAADARRTQSEVEYLMREYGWPAAKILNMSRERRLLYLEAAA